MPDVHKNFAQSTIASGPAPPDAGTSLLVAPGDGARFGAPCNLTVWPPGVGPTFANAEIVRATAIAGDVITIARAQEGTPARSIAAGWNVADTVTVKLIADLSANVALTNVSNTFTPPQTFNGNLLITGLLNLQPVASSPNFGVSLYTSYLPNNSNAVYVVCPNGWLGYTWAQVYNSATMLLIDQSGNIVSAGTIREQNRTTPLGFWQNFAADSSYFAVGTPSGGNWGVGTVTTYTYALVGKTLHLQIYVNGGTWYVGNPSMLVAIPPGLYAGNYAKGTAFITNATMPYETCFVFATPGSNWLTINRNGTAAFPAGASVNMFLEITMPIQ